MKSLVFLIAGLLAQGYGPATAAGLGAYLHGHAGDRLAWRGSQAGLTAMALARELTHAWRDVAAR